MRIISKDLDRTSEKGEQLERPVCRCKDTIKADFKEIIWERLEWVFGSGCRAMMVMCEHIIEPYLP
jgi:hypothetical protein